MRRASKALAALCLAGFAATGSTGGFAPREPVTTVAGPRIFHHPDSAGRKSLAVGQEAVVAVWEDNRDGAPQVYAALRPVGAAAFKPEIRLSSGTEAYEPAVVAVGSGAHVAAWEQDGAIWARGITAAGAGPAVRLGDRPAVQVSLAPIDATRAAAVFAQQRGKHRQIVATTLAYDPGKREITPTEIVVVESDAPPHDQLYPSVAVTPAGWCVAWEDRRYGHTRLFWAHAADARRFSKPQVLNEFHANRNAYDKGTGVTRVTLARFGERGVAAAWMDKREGHKAYAIVGTVSGDGGRTFGKRLRIHDDFGDDTLHYNPALAGDASGRLVAVWEDLRNETADLWYSVWNGSTWSDNHLIEPAGTRSEESNAAIALDGAGSLHVIWVDKPAPGKPTQLWYSVGKID